MRHVVQAQIFYPLLNMGVITSFLEELAGVCTAFKHSTTPPLNDPSWNCFLLGPLSAYPDQIC